MRGEITVRVACLLPEKLLERALREGARFDDVRRDGAHGLIVGCDEDSAAILLNQCARFHLDAATLARRGRSAARDRARRRPTLPVGIALCVALCWMFLGRVWLIDIDFTGEAAALGDRAALRQAVAAAGIHPGIGRNIDLDALAQSLKAGAGDYSYVGARLRGVRLRVEAAPEVPSPPLYDVEAARDLVAERDGIVVSAVAQSGVLCVQPGDAVRRGQLLIRGEELAPDDGTHPIAALGEVRVRAWFTGEAACPLRRSVSRLTGRASTSSRLVAPWFSLALTDGEHFAAQRETLEYLPIGGLFLPLEIERATRRETEAREVATDLPRAKAQLAPLAFADAALRLAREGPKDCEILRQWIDYETAGGTLRARAVYEICVDAAVTREALAGSDHGDKSD